MSRDQLSLIIFNIIYAVFVVCIYHFKKKIKSPELSMLGYLLDVNLVSAITELIAGLTVVWFGVNSIITKGANKFYVITMAMISLLNLLYVLLVSYNETERNKFYKKVVNTGLVLFVIYFISVVILPIEVIGEGTVHSTGPFVLPLLIFGFLTSVVMYYFMIHGLRKNKTSIVKYIPMIVMSLGYIVLVLLQEKYPLVLTLFSLLETFMLIIMYFTIENPDVKMIRELNIAKSEAEKANRAKSDFLSSMSHEVRTPLNQIMGFTEDIKQRKDDIPVEVYEDAEFIMEASNKLLELLSNILDVNKIESSGVDIKEEKYNFKEEINKITTINSTRINSKSLNLVVEQSDNIPEYLFGDITHIREIVNNILSNSIKYTDEGSITVGTSCDIKGSTCNLKIEIKDTGKGMSKSQLDNLFTKFNRSEENVNSTISGAGLGLVIVKSLVDQLKGKIDVISEEGKGTTVTVTIPQKML